MIRVLLVDNCYPSRDQKAGRLRDYGYLVNEFEGVQEAYPSLARTQYHTAIIDASADCLVRGNRTLVEILKEEYPSIQRIATSAESDSVADPLLIASFHRIMIHPGIKELLGAINNPIYGERT